MIGNIIVAVVALIAGALNVRVGLMLRSRSYTTEGIGFIIVASYFFIFPPMIGKIPLTLSFIFLFIMLLGLMLIFTGFILKGTRDKKLYGLLVRRYGEFRAAYGIIPASARLPVSYRASKQMESGNTPAKDGGWVESIVATLALLTFGMCLRHIKQGDTWNLTAVIVALVSTGVLFLSGSRLWKGRK